MMKTGDTVYTVEGQLAWGHCLKIFDPAGNELGTVKQRVFTFLPKFELFLGDSYLGCIYKEFSLFVPRFNIDCNGWQVDGSFMEWDYRIAGRPGERGGRHQQGAVPFDGYICDRRP